MMNKKRKSLIIKTGFSEFLDRGISTTVSYGDVLMCTAILHCYKKDHVTWVTSWAASEIVKNNPYIDKLLIFGPSIWGPLTRSSYDILINLEKDMGICAFLSRIKAPKRYGFYFDEKRHNIASYKPQTRFLLSGQEHQTDIEKMILEILFEAIGRIWKGEGFILERKSRKKESHDIGFNYSVGSKWPTKAWPKSHWKELEKILGKKYTISWQQGQKNLNHYFDWIDSCRVVVTSDSLGQSIAQVFGKKVVTLFGPTNYKRMQGLKNITSVCSKLRCPYMPCYLPVCKYKKFCMEYIDPQKVASVCERLLQ